jgi:ribosome-binding factor A
MRSQDFSRSRRVADQLGRELASLLLEAIDDPRVRGATVSGVDLSPDLRNATVFVTLPAQADVGAAMQALNRASGLLRRRLASRVRLKYLPALSFQHDATLDRVDRIEELLDKARTRRP